MQTSAELRDTVATLEAAAHQAGAKLIQAETDHRTALRRAVESGDFTLSIASEAALADARRDHDRANTSRQVAQQLHAEAVKREKQAERDTARAGIEAELSDMAEIAHGLDTAFAALVGQLVRLRDREAALHQAARRLWRSPWAAPLSLGAARPLATYLATLSNGGQPDAAPVIATAVEAGAANIRTALNAD